jgi:hypothetical protein
MRILLWLGVLGVLGVPLARAQASSSSAAGKPASLAPDPYAPLRLYDGKWEVRVDSKDKPADPVRIENHCARAGDYFVCNQFMAGKNIALVVFLPVHPLENGGYAYRNQALRTEGENTGAWGDLAITGDRWLYSSDETDKGMKTHWQTVNVFSGKDKIHFEIRKSDDGVKWTTSMSGDEARVE